MNTTSRQECRTTVGTVARDVLDYTAGRDAQLDRALITVDCLGSAAHAVMLARMPVRPPLFSPAELRKTLRALDAIAGDAMRGRFGIETSDQDVHMAVERELTRRTGDLGRRIHTGRSRNDQAALDLRLFARERLLTAMRHSVALMRSLLVMARLHRRTPMVGRTHLQPAMPSSVALWATAYVEEMDENLETLRHVYDLNNRCPLGAAAGYGVPLPLDRALTARLLGFDAPIHNVLHAVQSRGKNEARILDALAQTMLTLARLSQDIIIFSMPEFGYFRLPPGLGTGSSIMPQKNNPDVLELARARAARLRSHAAAVFEIVRALPCGYHRDLQETKEPLMEGFAIAESTLRVIRIIIEGLEIDRRRLRDAFTAPVFAADQALALVRQGIPFREAYRRVKDHPESVAAGDPDKNIGAKAHLGAPGGLDFAYYRRRSNGALRWITASEGRIRQTLARLLPRTAEGLVPGGDGVSDGT